MKRAAVIPTTALTEPLLVLGVSGGVVGGVSKNEKFSIIVSVTHLST